MVRRDFRLNPLRTHELRDCYWYVVKNDEIGGWSLATVDLPTSQINPYAGVFELGTFMSEGIARHMAGVHNTWWENLVWDSYRENLEWSFGQALRDYYAGITPPPAGVAEVTEDDWFDYEDELDNR